MPIGAGSDLEFIWLIVIVLIGIVSAIRGFIQKRMHESRRAESGEKPPPPVATQVRQEILKYLGEIKGPAKKKQVDERDLAAGHAETAAVDAAAAADAKALRTEPVLSPPPTPPVPTRQIVFPPRKEPERIVRRRIIRRRVVKKSEPEKAPSEELLPGLMSHENLRRAILYREILGPPVSMRRMARPASRLTRR